jgi:hypothetical protein
MRKTLALSLLFLVSFAVKAIAADNPMVTSLSGETFTVQELKESKNAVLFWRSDCAPCLIEMQHVPEIAITHPDTHIALIALQDKEAMQKQLPENLPNNIEVFFVDKEIRGLLLAFGNERAVLPFSVWLHQDGTICARNYGMLTLERFTNWRKTC